MKSRFPYILIILILLVALFFKKCESPVPPPEQSISFDEARKLQNQFLQTRSPILREGLGFDDHRDFWFSLDTIKKYINYVEYEATQKGLEDLGLRIYFAAYTEPQGDAEYPFSTVVITPTARSGDNPLQKGFFPLPPDDDNLEGVNSLNFGHGGQPPNDL